MKFPHLQSQYFIVAKVRSSLNCEFQSKLIFFEFHFFTFIFNIKNHNSHGLKTIQILSIHDDCVVSISNQVLFARVIKVQSQHNLATEFPVCHCWKLYSIFVNLEMIFPKWNLFSNFFIYGENDRLYTWMMEAPAYSRAWNI